MTSSPGNPGPSSGIRASDAERERVAEELRRHHLDGRLDTDELQERLGRCYAARTDAELARLLADLPGEERRGGAGRAAGGGVPIGMVLAGVVLVAVLFATFGAVAHGHHHPWPFPFPLLAVLLLLKLGWGGPRRRRAAWRARRG
jgi:hypothetical protein